MRAVFLLFCVTGLQIACTDNDTISPVGSQGGAGGVGGANVGAGAGDGGEGGGLPPDRGDPANFPTDCLETCESACSRLNECDADQSPVHPIVEEECLARCALAVDGQVWDDVSQNFRCCASQDACENVQHCGGWLEYPSAVEPCEALCSCFAGASVGIAALTQGHVAPTGYRFATDMVMVDDVQADLSRIPGLAVHSNSAKPILKVTEQEAYGTLLALAQVARILPTFTDRSGAVVAASGRLIVHARVPQEVIAADRVGRGFALHRSRKLNFGGGLYVYDAADPWQALDALSALRSAGIEAELDMVRHYQTMFTPNDPLYGESWHLENNGQRESIVSVDGRIDEAWDITLGDPSVIIAINDDGVDLNHPDFAGRLEPELNYPTDWAEQMAQGAFGSHGTSVAGVAGASADNSIAGAGVCPGCRILPHLLGPSTVGQFQITDLDVAEGFTSQVNAGASIISNSWGPSTGNPLYEDSTLPAPGLSSVVKAAFDYAESDGRGGLGTVILFASGNSNDVLAAYDSYATNLSVGATSNLGLKAYYSSFGTALDISAPSNGGLAGITTTAINGETTDDFGGTSSACPYAAGVMGLILSANPALTAAQARAIIQDSATPIDPMYGAYNVDGLSPFYGNGLVNAYAAVQTANGTCADPTQCFAPSDNCGANCGTGGTCDICRTDSDCLANYKCQALPSLGIMSCVADATVIAPCPAGTQATNGYCKPTLESCGLCGNSEACNGRDDDCDGEVDEDDVCDGNELCFIDGLGCPSGKVCAGNFCLTQCGDESDCGDDQQCLLIKDQYGAYSGQKACVTSFGSQCQIGCEVLVSSQELAIIDEFVTCMDGQICGPAIFECVQILPINF